MSTPCRELSDHHYDIRYPQRESHFGERGAPSTTLHGTAQLLHLPTTVAPFIILAIGQ